MGHFHHRPHTITRPIIQATWDYYSPASTTIPTMPIIIIRLNSPTPTPPPPIPQLRMPSTVILQSTHTGHNFLFREVPTAATPVGLELAETEIQTLGVPTIPHITLHHSHKWWHRCSNTMSPEPFHTIRPSVRIMASILLLPVK